MPFSPTYSTDEIYVGEDFEASLTDKLTDMENDISDKAPNNHTHTGYAPLSHSHTPNEIGAAESNHTHTGYASEDHTHTGFASENHIHNATPVLTAGTNLDNYVTDGIWSFAQAYTPTNIPAGSNGWLVVITWGDGGGTVKQYWLRHGVPGENDHEVYTRMKTVTDPWCDWSKFYTNQNPPTADEIGYNDLKNGSITKASGVSSWDVTVKYNDFKACVYGTFQFSSALAGGQTATIGTNLPTAMRPKNSSETSVTFYGTRPLVIRVTPTGTLEVRNASESQLAANSSVSFRISYSIF